MRRRASATLLSVALATAITACFSAAEPGDLSIYGPYTGAEADIFGEVIASFEDATGITTTYVGSASFQSDFADRVNSADLADVTILPQPALLEPLVSEDRVVALDDETSAAVVETVGDQWAAVVSNDAGVFGVPYRFVVKSLVWYRADIFAEQGYPIPETLAELKALARRMVADGFVPWCAGMDSESATGWWATDWVEDLMARRSPDVYMQWATLDVPFTDGTVVAVLREFQDLMGDDDAVAGGSRAILNVRVEDAIRPMFEDDPGCLMHKQASFQPVWLPEGVEYGDGTLDIFPLPDVEPGAPPVVVSGELAVATSDNPAAAEFLRYLLTDESFQPWNEAGGSLVARAEIVEDSTKGALDERLTEIVNDTDLVVYDASDLMPQAVGTGSFFEGMIDLMAGSSPSEVARQIQDSVDALPG